MKSGGKSCCDVGRNPSAIIVEPSYPVATEAARAGLRLVNRAPRRDSFQNELGPIWHPLSAKLKRGRALYLETYHTTT